MAMPEDVTVKGGAEAGSGVQAALHRTFGMHGGGASHHQLASAPC